MYVFTISGMRRRADFSRRASTRWRSLPSPVTRLSRCCGGTLISARPTSYGNSDNLLDVVASLPDTLPIVVRQLEHPILLQHDKL